MLCDCKTRVRKWTRRTTGRNDDRATTAGLIGDRDGRDVLEELSDDQQLERFIPTLETYTFDFWGYVVASSSQASPSVQEVLANTPWPVAQEIRSYFEDPDFTLLGL